MRQFEVGKHYAMHSPCNQDCQWRYTVTARTKGTVTLRSNRGETKVCRINKRDSEYLDAEAVRPLGSFSMSPILTADKIAH